MWYGEYIHSLDSKDRFVLPEKFREKVKELKSRLSLAAMMAMLPSEYFDMMGPPRPDPKPKRKCLNCGELHNHNNAWCSAECCKEWRKK